MSRTLHRFLQCIDQRRLPLLTPALEVDDRRGEGRRGAPSSIASSVTVQASASHARQSRSVRCYQRHLRPAAGWPCGRWSGAGAGRRGPCARPRPSRRWPGTRRGGRQGETGRSRRPRRSGPEESRQHHRRPCGLSTGTMMPSSISRPSRRRTWRSEMPSRSSSMTLLGRTIGRLPRCQSCGWLNAISWSTRSRTAPRPRAAAARLNAASAWPGEPGHAAGRRSGRPGS